MCPIYISRIEVCVIKRYMLFLNETDLTDDLSLEENIEENI